MLCWIDGRLQAFKHTNPMISITTVSRKSELQQIHLLNQKNLKSNLSAIQQQQEGFVTWSYSTQLLQQIHQLAPSIIAKEGDVVVGYALATLREATVFHPELDSFLKAVENLQYKGIPLSQHRFYCMGQICVDKEYRGKGLLREMYNKHRETYSSDFDFILTDIATNNPRSLRAHFNVGFNSICQFKDVHGKWDVVVWDWS